MSNHCKVKTKKPLTCEAIDEVILDLNKRLFKNLLKIEYNKSTKESPGWGKHTWLVKFKDYASLVFWSNNSKHFEISHGHYGNWGWWIDFAITNEIAVKFDGIIIDDGIDEKLKGIPHKYDDFFETFVELSNLNRSSAFQNIELLKGYLNYELNYVPLKFKKEFQTKAKRFLENYEKR